VDFDGIFVGGGHNALVAAAYLAGAGARVAVVESAPSAGGGLATVELTRPGFRHNLAAYFSRWTPQYRIWKDLALDRTGLTAMVPDVQVGVPLAAGGGLVLYREIERSVAEIRRFSARDADTWAALYPQSLEIARDVVGALRFSPPIDAAERRDLLSRSAAGRRYLDFERQAPLDAVRSLFESEVVRSALLFNIATRAYLPLLKTPGTGYIVPMAIAAAHNTAIHPGGSELAARALTDAVTSRGGAVLTSSPVAEIVVTNGRASGVLLADGRRIGATKFVGSSVPAPVTLGQLVTAGAVPQPTTAKMERYRWQADSIFGVHLALREAPRYGGGDSDLNRALNQCVGAESSDDWEAQHDAVQALRIPPIGFEAAVPSLFDPTVAPDGCATAFAWQLVPRNPADRWLTSAAGDLAAAIVDRWRAYAPNLRGAEIARAIHHPLDTARAFPAMVLGDRHHGSYHPDNFDDQRPAPELAHYRTPIDGLYLCGSSSFPGGSFTGQPGYNAAGAIAEDFGYECWWKPVHAREALSRLK
jgi:phytoene dehydrogenase-like protein